MIVKIIRLAILPLLLALVTPVAAYDILFDADDPEDLGTVPVILGTLAQSRISSDSTRWKSMRLQATASGTVTHFIVQICTATSNPLPFGFAVYEAGSNQDDPPGDLIAKGYSASYTFSNTGFYAFPFTGDTTFQVTSGTWYHLVFLLDAGEADAVATCRMDLTDPPISGVNPEKWASDCAGAACEEDDPPGSGGDEISFAEENTHYDPDSASWVAGLLITTLGYPNSLSATGTWTHGESKTITGAEFGTKSPAAPLWWDDMEGAEDGSTTFTSGELTWVTSGVLSGSSKHYSEAENVGSETLANITYRSSTFRSVGGPHARSTRFATGAHWQYDDNDPPYAGTGSEGYDNVVLTVDSGSADKSVWYARWYYRVDPNWTMINSWENHKKSVVNYGTTAYDSPNCYMSSGSSESEGGAVGDTVQWGIENIVNRDSNPCTLTQTTNGANAKDSWVGVQQLWDSPNGTHEIWLWDGGVGGSGRKVYCDSSDADCADMKNNTRSFSMGGWYATNSNASESVKRGGQDNYRYFDDIYIDNTFSRVMLCNNATYTSATICEPQIPSAWSASSITVTVNLGALTGDTAYLYVFDSDNNANATGYEVTLGESGSTPATITGVFVGSFQ